MILEHRPENLLCESGLGRQGREQGGWIRGSVFRIALGKNAEGREEEGPSNAHFNHAIEK